MAYNSDVNAYPSSASRSEKAGRRKDHAGAGAAASEPKLSWEDIGYFGNAIAIASRQWRSAAKAVRDEYALGPHGPWIVGLMASTHVLYPSDLTRVLRCGRSLISAELNKLSEAGLINTRKSEDDGRQIELTLTPLGAEVNARIAEGLTTMVEERLVHHSRDEVMACANLLRDLAGGGARLS